MDVRLLVLRLDSKCALAFAGALSEDARKSSAQSTHTSARLATSVSASDTETRKTTPAQKCEVRHLHTDATHSLHRRHNKGSPLFKPLT